MTVEAPDPKTVLVVDDHAPLRTLCRVNLEPAGFRVLEAGDGARCSNVSGPSDLT
jgi:CheY-like chemotaxis protein